MAATLVSLSLTPAIAGTETRQLVNTDQLYPTAGAGTFGTPNAYPSTINVSGLSGTVTNVTVMMFLASSAGPDDIDMALVGPNGQRVMLMSDACGETDSNRLSNDTFTFDDSALTFVPNGGPRPSFQTASNRPSNYLGNQTEPDDLDGAAFTACSSPLDLKVDRGRHQFEVRAIDAAGNIDPSPATRSWKVKKK